MSRAGKPQAARHRHLGGLSGVERHGQVVEHHVTLGQRHVVHHRAARHFDVDGAPRLPVSTDHRVLHGVPAIHAVRNRMQLIGFRITLGMGGVAAGERAVEIADTDGVELVGHLEIGDTGLDQGEGPARMSDHVGVRADSGQPEVACRWGLAERSCGLRATHPAVPVPLGLAVSDADAVHHAVSDEPVIQLRGRSHRSGWDRCADTARRGNPESSPSPPGRSACTHGPPVRIRRRDSGSSSRHPR